MSDSYETWKVIIENSGLFDKAYYLREYPDVAAAGVDPLWHYFNFGFYENRYLSDDAEFNHIIIAQENIYDAFEKFNEFRKAVDCTLPEEITNTKQGQEFIISPFGEASACLSSVGIVEAKLKDISLLKGNVDSINSSDGVFGWALDPYNLDETLDITVEVNDNKYAVKANLMRSDVGGALGTSGIHGFYLPLAGKDLTGSCRVAVSVDGYNGYLQPSPYNIIFPIEYIKFQHMIRAIAKNDNSNLFLQNLTKYGDAKNSFFHIGDIDKVSSLLSHIPMDKVVTPAFFSDLNKQSFDCQVSDIVDIIIPVYKNFDDTCACINSVLSNEQLSKYELIVINDCSPESEINEFLKIDSIERGYTLIENEENLGFIQTVNKGMSLHSDRDVILLNSDAEVNGNWLDRMKGAAYSSNNIGTVTPFSNNAEIFSYPEFVVDTPLSKIGDWKKFDELAKQKNEGIVVDVPTAMGFCMYIKRGCLNEVGLFDAETFGKGYGEENDFCMRAYNLGWRHILAADIYACHKGGSSFGAAKMAMIEANLKKLSSKHPFYEELVRYFVQLDPIVFARRNIDISLLEAQSKDVVIMVVPEITGGTKKHIDKIAESYAAWNKDLLLLQYSGDINAPNKIRIISNSNPLLKSLIFDIQTEKDLFVSLLKRIGVSFVHYQHFVNMHDTLYELPQLLQCGYYITLHDYYTICPRINLIDKTGWFCGNVDGSKCNECVKTSGVHEMIWEKTRDKICGNINDYRNHFYKFLHMADKVFCPSDDMSKRIKSVFNLNNVVTKYHEVSDVCLLAKKDYVKAESSILTVGIIGAIGYHKGSDILLELAKYSVANNLNIRYLVIGFTDIDEELIKTGVVEITGEYEEEDLGKLISAYDINLFAFFSKWPETFCYTLSYAMSCNRPILAYDIGAFTERLTQRVKDNNAYCLSLDSSIANIAEKIQYLCEEFNSKNVDLRNEAIHYDSLNDYYSV